MLGSADAIATVAVKNLQTAAQFYEGKLGLRKLGDEMEVLVYQSGKSSI